MGNGTSRQDVNLFSLKDKGTIYGCNALYREFAPEYKIPDYLIAIDNKIAAEIMESNFPPGRFIHPSWEEQYEPAEMYDHKVAPPHTPRSNAGMNAMTEAIRAGHNELIMLGFDFLCVDESQCVSNLYDGSYAYGPETRTSATDSRNRMRYLSFFLINNKEITFKFCFPERMKVYLPDLPNVSFISTKEL